MAPKTPTRALALELLRLTPEENERRLSWALDESYWRTLETGLHLAPRSGAGARDEDATALAAIAAASTSSLDTAASTAHFRRHGYFHASGALDLGAITKVARCAKRLKETGWPPVFAFVFDEVWGVFRSPRIRTLLGSLLDGGDVRQIDRIWVHHVAPSGAGWAPHVDGLSAPHRVTLWIPLTEATPENGCIHVVPRSRIPDATVERFLDRSSDGPRLDHDELRALLQAVRALPASPGDVMGWDFGLLHWGSASSPGAPPRISMAAEFVRADEPETAAEPRSRMDTLPTFRERLATIANAILLYDRFETIAARYFDFAGRLLEALPERDP